MAEIPKGSFRFFINLRHCENLHFNALLILVALYAGAWQSTFVDITLLIYIKNILLIHCLWKKWQEIYQQGIYNVHKGRLPRSYFGASKYSLVMTIFISARQPNFEF